MPSSALTPAQLKAATKHVKAAKQALKDIKAEIDENSPGGSNKFTKALSKQRDAADKARQNVPFAEDKLAEAQAAVKEWEGSSDENAPKKLKAAKKSLEKAEKNATKAREALVKEDEALANAEAAEKERLAGAVVRVKELEEQLPAAKATIKEEESLEKMYCPLRSSVHERGHG